ncbi:MAG: DUF4174 domain-containing protein [Alphaproteobacteria bacterium]|nr:DUF4174 domain-containing protein [Alphaproteobacteria bacterium]
MAVIVDLSVYSFLFAFMTVSTEPSPMPTATLDAFQWRNRVVLSFIADEEMQAARDQREYRRKTLGEWRNRDLVLIEVGPRNRVLVDGKENDSIDGAGLRQRFAAASEKYVAVLVGKDGSEKLRSDRAITNDMLFATIDAMPMRRREMRRK